MLEDLTGRAADNSSRSSKEKKSRAKRNKEVKEVGPILPIQASTPLIEVPLLTAKPTEQEVIYEAMVSGQNHLIIKAVAGSGKTYVSLEGSKKMIAAHPGISIGYLVFGRANKEEMKAKAGSLIDSVTYHALGNRALYRVFGRLNINEDKMWKVINSLRKWDLRSFEDKMIRAGLKKLSGLAKGYGAETREVLAEIVERHDIDLFGFDDAVLEWMPIALDKAADVQRGGEIDYDDQPWIPWRMKLEIPKYDMTISDECLLGDTPILMPDYSTRTIKDLVDSKYKGKVLSYDPYSHKTVEKKICGWYEIPLSKDLRWFRTQRIGITGNGLRMTQKSAYVRFGSKVLVCTNDHKIMVKDGEEMVWKHSKDLKVGDIVVHESHAGKNKSYQHKHKHGEAGLKNLSRLMRKKNKAGVCGTYKPPKGIFAGVQGGNGRGPTKFERALLTRLGPPWVCGLSVSLNNRPYKLDLANPEDKIAIELDGNSHFMSERKAQDKKKERLLRKAGWDLIRMTNRDSVNVSDELLHQVVENSPVWAEVTAIGDWRAREPYVYDIDVEDTHNFYANGIVVHNSQDLSPVQQWLVVNSSDRVMVIGDPRQAIFQFRGASVRSMELIADELRGSRIVDEFPLSVTRRCPKSHVELAQKIVPHIRAMDDAPDGVIRKGVVNASGAEPGDLVICRVNAPLIEAAYALIAKGVPASIKGRDLAAGINKLLDKAEKKSGGGLREALMEARTQTERDVDRFLSMPDKKGEQRAANAQDRMTCLATAARGCETLMDLRRKMANIFSEKSNAVNLATGHAGKGLEGNRVWILNPELIPHPMAKKAQDIECESNLAYVMVTRAKYDKEKDKPGELVFCGDLPPALGGPKPKPWKKRDWGAAEDEDDDY